MYATLLFLEDICHDFIWRVNTLSTNLGFCNISNYLCHTVHLSMAYVCGTYKTNVLNVNKTPCFTFKMI